MSMRFKLKKSEKNQNETVAENDIDVVSANSETVKKPMLHISIIRFVVAVLLVLAVIAAGAVLFVSIKTYFVTSQQTEDYYARADKIQNDISNNLAVMNDKFAVDRLNLFFTKDEVYSFSYSLWKYELLINGTPVEKTTANLTLNPGDTISLRESLVETLLPKDFVNIGNLTRGDANDSIKNHFSLYTQTYQLVEKSEGFVTTYTAENLELKSGTTFNMLFSVQLQERLQFEKDVIVVTVK
jgi:archaellum component FlaF (FlaF/FlaG flagellin family)